MLNFKTAVFPVSLAMVATVFLACGGGDGGGSTSTGSSTSGGGGSGGGASTATASSTGTGGPAAMCMSGGTAIDALPACTAAATKAVTVPKGCEPAVDGVMHTEEWSDGACFNIAAGDLVVTMKYASDAVYMAMSGPPTCGCGMGFYFLPASGKNFVISVFDDPFGTDGDRSDFTLTAMGLQPGTKNQAIEIRGPGNQPTPVRYEWKIPYSALELTAGQAGKFKMAIVHSSVTWPAGLDQTMGKVNFAADEPTWAEISSPSWD